MAGAAFEVYTGAAVLSFQVDDGLGYISGGIEIGAQSTNNLIDDASTGAGSTTLYIGNASINVTSDRRVKCGIEDFQGSALDILAQAHVVTGEYISELVGDLSPYGYTKRGRHVMLIAQEMREWAPWAVNAGDGTEREDFYWQVEYDRIVPLAVAGINELSRASKHNEEWNHQQADQLGRHEDRLWTMRQILDSLQTTNEALEARVAELERPRKEVVR